LDLGLGLGLVVLEVAMEVEAAVQVGRYGNRSPSVDKDKNRHA